MLLLKILIGEYIIYGFTGVLSGFFKGGIIEATHKMIEKLYFLQLDSKMKAWWDVTFAVHGPIWNFFGNLPHTTYMTVLKVVLGLNILSIAVIVVILFSILLNYKVLLLVFIPELFYRLYRMFVCGEPIVLGYSWDYYNPFDPNSLTKGQKQKMDNVYNSFYGYSPENDRMIQHMEEYERQKELDILCPGLTDTEDERHLQKVRAAKEFKAWKERHDQGDPTPWKSPLDPKYQSQPQSSNQASHTQSHSSQTPRQSSSSYNNYGHYSAPYTKKDASILPSGMSRAKAPGHFSEDEAARIAKRQAERRVSKNDPPSRPQVKGVRYSDTQYFLKPKQ